MRIYLDQIPEGVDTSEYPADTEFVMDDTRPQWDAMTGKVIRPERRPLIYPKEAWAERS